MAVLWMSRRHCGGSLAALVALRAYTAAHAAAPRLRSGNNGSRPSRIPNRRVVWLPAPPPLLHRPACPVSVFLTRYAKRGAPCPSAVRSAQPDENLCFLTRCQVLYQILQHGTYCGDDESRRKGVGGLRDGSSASRSSGQGVAHPAARLVVSLLCAANMEQFQFGLRGSSSRPW